MSDGDTPLIDGDTVERIEAEHGPICAVKSMGRVFGFRRAKRAEARLFRSRSKQGDDEADVKLMQACVVYCSDGDALQMLNQHLDEYVFSDTQIAGALIKFCGYDPKASGAKA